VDAAENTSGGTAAQRASRNWLCHNFTVLANAHKLSLRTGAFMMVKQEEHTSTVYIHSPVPFSVCQSFVSRIDFLCCLSPKGLTASQALRVKINVLKVFL